MEKKFSLPVQSESNLGFVLLSTILMLVLLGSIILSLWQGVLQFWKIYNEMQKQHQTLYTLEKAASQIQQLPRDPNCLITDFNPNVAVQKLQDTSCLIVVAKHEYNYNYSQLTDYPCLQLEVHKKLYGTQHWFLTLSIRNNPEEVLQLRIAKPVKGLVCRGGVKVLKGPLLNWRYLHVRDL